MAISRISALALPSPTISIPGAYAAGDLIIVAACRANTTPATVPAGWVTLSTAGANGVSLVIASKYAQSASESAASFAGAGILLCGLYRGSLGIVFPSMGIAAQGTISSIINYGSVTNFRAGVEANWYLSFGAQLNTANSLETAPTGMANVNFETVSGSLKGAFHDTNGNQFSNWTAPTVTLPNSAAYRSGSIQISEMIYPAPSGGGGSYSPIDNLLIG
jgi:hypothetical protein